MFAQISSKLHQAQKSAAKGDAEGAGLAADSMGDVVSKVEERWLGSLDKEEPDLAEEFLRKMKDAISEVHATEGFAHGKIAKARDTEDDWLTKLVASNSKMQSMIPKAEGPNRRAIWDS